LPSLPADPIIGELFANRADVSPGSFKKSFGFS